LRAARALGKLDDLRAAEPLIKALGDYSWEVAKASAEALETLGEPVWARMLAGDEGFYAQLGKSGDARAVTPLLKALGRGKPYDFERRLDSVVALGELGDARAVEPLIAVLNAEVLNARFDLSMMKAVATALGKLGDARGVEPLLRAIRKHYHFSEAIEALGALGDTRAIEEVLYVLTWSKDIADVRVAAEALRKLGGLQSVIKATTADCGFVARRMLAKMLGESGNRTAKEALIPLLGDGDHDVRVATAEALKTLGEPSWAEIIRGDCKDVERLCECDDARVVGALIIAAETGHASIVAHRLAKSKDERALAPLINALASSEPCEAAAALGEIGDVRAVSPMIMALGAKQGVVRRAIATALGKLGEPRWADIIRGDDDDMKRLCECGDARATAALLRRDQNSVDIALALVKRGCPNAVKFLIYPLVRTASSRSSEDLDSCYAERYRTATEILALAQQPDARKTLLSSSDWPRIHELITQPHRRWVEEELCGSPYSDSTWREDVYHDCGVGINIRVDLEE
jgi:HEAT repeat protein